MDMSFETPTADVVSRREESYEPRASAPTAAMEPAAPPAPSRQRTKIAVAILVGLPVGLVVGAFIAIASGLLPFLC